MNRSDRFPRRFPPPFASAWGDDEYGLWADLEVLANDGASVVQKLRWIEPGRFLMGSPETEAERLSFEGPQHDVTLSKGFWLFDTACTQALWQAVMGSNPSRFKSSDRPVDSVCWDDVQAFLAKMKRMPGAASLALGLPSEAQWEYACRAGTTTPFSFGKTITPEQVNYSGEHPYRGGKKGLNRGETVPVASLPVNPWGLYEMHGNVWEFCADHWHDNYESAPCDGGAWIEAELGAYHVVRGGSFFYGAGHARSASRFLDLPGLRDLFFGFRCARVQEP